MGNTLNKSKTIQNFKSKGFQEYPSKSVDHVWMEFWNDGKLTSIRTKFSHGSDKDLNDFLIGHISKQTKMPKKFMIEFAKCTKSQADYVKLLQENKHIDVSPIEQEKI